MIETKLLPITQESIDLAAEYLRKGTIFALPTETVYGIAASAYNGEAVKDIFRAKGRPQDNPLIVHIAKMDMLYDLTREVSEDALKLAKAFWPGPLTMILPRSEKVADEVCAGLDTVGIRWPSHPVAQKVILESGLPFAAPSANLSGSPSPTNAQDVYQDMNGRLALILDGGESDVGVESTVVSMVEDTPVILRPGYVTKEDLEGVLGKPVALSHAILEKLGEGETARSPGMKYKHYAPKAQITILQGSLEKFREYVSKFEGQPGIFCLCFEGEEASLPLPCVTYGQEGDGASQAHDLFRSLRHLDEEGAVKVYARGPKQDGVSMAVYNRLLRAAAFQVVEL